MTNRTYGGIAVVSLAGLLGACGGDDSSSGGQPPLPEPLTYQEIVSSYVNSDFSATGDSLDGVWVLVSTSESTGVPESDFDETETDVNIVTTILSMRESDDGDSVSLMACAAGVEESGSGSRFFPRRGSDGFTADIELNDADENSILDFDESDVNGVFDSPTTIIVETNGGELGEGELSFGAFATFIKLSDTYTDSIGTVSIDGEERDTACLAFGRSDRLNEVSDEGEIFNFEQEVLSIEFSEGDFLEGLISGSVNGPGDFDDFFEADLTFPQLVASDNEGLLTVVDQGPFDFSGSAQIEIPEEDVVSIEFDISLDRFLN